MSEESSYLKLITTIRDRFKTQTPITIQETEKYWILLQ